MAKASRSSSYSALIEGVFFDLYGEGVESFEFDRAAIEHKARQLEIQLPKNIGDVIYSFRYRKALLLKILETQPRGQEWIIAGAGMHDIGFVWSQKREFGRARNWSRSRSRMQRRKSFEPTHWTTNKLCLLSFGTIA